VIVGAVLAAGVGSRLGRPKALLDWHGRPLVRHLVEVALRSGLDRVIVVVGPQAEEVRRALQGLPVDLVYNYYFGLGQSTSVQAALGALPPGTEAVVFLLVDQPFISPELVRSVVEAYRRTRRPIVLPQAPGRPGNPVLFSRTLFVELLGLRGDRAAGCWFSATPTGWPPCPWRPTRSSWTSTPGRTTRPPSSGPIGSFSSP